MPQMKSSVAILMGVVILIADVAWLIVGSSYTYTPWLVLGIVIFIAALVWLAVDLSLMREAKSPDTRKEERSASDVKK
jgi:hypothetical protein